MGTVITNTEKAVCESSSSNAAELQKSISSVESNHPALSRLRKKIEGQPADSSVLTDYSRMHHRHNRD